MTPPIAENGDPSNNRSPLDTLLYDYITNPDPHQPNPLTYFDEEVAHWTAAHGPRSNDEAHHILTTPRLLTLLTALWDEEPPTAHVLTTLQSTHDGQALLSATGHEITSSREQDVNEISLNNLITDIEFYLLTHTEQLSPSFRGDTTTTNDPTTHTVWTYHAPATTTHPELILTITHQAHATTEVPTLYITLTNTTNLPITHTPWTLTWTHTTPGGHTHTHTHTDTQTPTPPLPTTWTIPTTHTPSTDTHITLTPTP